jgi:hypothetical protein
VLDAAALAGVRRDLDVPALVVVGRDLRQLGPEGLADDMHRVPVRVGGDAGQVVQLAATGRRMAHDVHAQDLAGIEPDELDAETADVRLVVVVLVERDAVDLDRAVVATLRVGRDLGGGGIDD